MILAIKNCILAIGLKILAIENAFLATV